MGKVSSLYRTNLVKRFLKRWPYESLSSMTLSDYASTSFNGSFCYWLEEITKDIGSLWGGLVVNFVVNEHGGLICENTPNRMRDEVYEWNESFDVSTAEEAFGVVWSNVMLVAQYAREGRFDEIPKVNLPCNFLRWKVAFLYADYQLIPLFDLNILRSLAKRLDIDSTDRVEILMELNMIRGERNVFEFADELLASYETPNPDEPHVAYEPHLSFYTDQRFLNNVYMSEQDLQKLKRLLRINKNLILAGAPGVGKTFAAKRLAYVTMGVKDEDCVEMVQFHENYSYEAFVEGYMPNDMGGFELRDGVFYSFCQKALAHPEKEYFFIIDEINRGNMSKIFGELFMLIEKDYRGEKHKMKMAYSKRFFYVPENVYLIGLMNTADRSLAMIDYALRRRFAFQEFKPGFDTLGFKAYQSELDSPILDRLIMAVKELNQVIIDDNSLGKGFCIGHSYFCNLRKSRCDRDGLEYIVENKIAPLLEEYWFDDKERCVIEIAKLKRVLR